MLEDYSKSDTEDAAADWYENNSQELAGHLQFLDDEYRYKTAHEQGDGSGYTTNKIRAMRLTPELREKIKRIGVPLWTVPAAGAGLEALLSGQEDQPGYAGGGLVGKGLREVVQDIKNENAYAGRRAERIMDEEPRLASILSPRGLERLAMDPAPVLMMRPDIRPDKASEYRRLALPLIIRNPDVMPPDDFMHSANLLEKFRDEGMNVPPLLAGDILDGGEVMQMTTHDGRHRAFGLGEIMGMKTPVQFDRVRDLGAETTAERNKYMRGLGTQTVTDMLNNLRPAYQDPAPPLPPLRDATLELLEELLSKLNKVKKAKQEQSGYVEQPKRETSLRNKKGDRFFAAGGVVKQKAKKIGEKARELGMLKKYSEGRARIASAALSNLYGVTPEGELTDETLPSFSMEDGFSWPNRPGLVEGTLGLAELLLPEAITPDVVRGSGERYEQTLGQIQDAMAVAPAESYPEHLQEALGNMLTQVPVPATKAAQGVRGVLSGLAEFVSPVVNPSLRNYAGGTLVGGTFTKALQELAERLPGIQETLSRDPLGAMGVDPQAPNPEQYLGR